MNCQCFLNYFIAATDAHVKNCSILLEADGAHRLASIYDVASIAPYIDPAAWEARPPKLAMSMGGENRVGRVTMGALHRLAGRCGLEEVGVTAEGCANLVRAYAEPIPARLAKVFDALERTESAAAARELRAHTEEPITRLCDTAMAGLHA